VLRSSAVGDSEVENHFADAVLVGQRPSADVDVVQTWVVEYKTNVMSSVDQRAARLQQNNGGTVVSCFPTSIIYI